MNRIHVDYLGHSTHDNRNLCPAVAAWDVYCFIPFKTPLCGTSFSYTPTPMFCTEPCGLPSDVYCVHGVRLPAIAALIRNDEKTPTVDHIPKQFCACSDLQGLKAESECTSCWPGYYSADVGATGSSTCLECPTNFSQPNYGAVSLEACTVCLNGSVGARATWISPSNMKRILCKSRKATANTAVAECREC